MAIRTRNKISATFSLASMSDLVFLLLIFFMITSTLVAPNFIKILLSSSNSTIAQQTLSVYIDSEQNFFVDEIQVNKDMLQSQIAQKLAGQTEGTIVLKADKSVNVQDLLTVLDAVDVINKKNGTRHKVILATLSK